MAIALVEAPIDVAALTAAGGAESGGLVLFVGRVRGDTGGRRVLRLEYEAYGPMARRELERLEERVRAGFDVHRVDIVHRIGVLALGEVAVAIAVWSKHRAAGFEACRFAIDELKKTVPIWKKEFFEDGAVWVGDRP